MLIFEESDTDVRGASSLTGHIKCGMFSPPILLLPHDISQDYFDHCTGQFHSPYLNFIMKFLTTSLLAFASLRFATAVPTSNAALEARAAEENIGCPYVWCITKTKRGPEEEIGCPYAWCITKRAPTPDEEAEIAELESEPEGKLICTPQTYPWCITKRTEQAEDTDVVEGKIFCTPETYPWCITKRDE